MSKSCFFRLLTANQGARGEIADFFIQRARRKPKRKLRENKKREVTVDLPKENFTKRRERIINGRITSRAGEEKRKRKKRRKEEEEGGAS
jgi:hypothetical protein